MKSEEIYQRFVRLRAEKEPGLELMRVVNQFFQPSDEIYQGNQQVGLNLSQKGELLDTTVTEVIEEYVSNVLGLYFNTEVAWFKIELPELNIASGDQQVLTRRAQLLYKLISKSNYYAVCPQHEWDVLVHGHGLMIIEKDEDDFARCYTKQPIDLYFQQSEDYRVIETYWENELTNAAFIHKYPQYANQLKTTSSDIISRHQVVHCVVPNNEFYREGLDPMIKAKMAASKEKFMYRVVLSASSVQSILPKKDAMNFEIQDPMPVADNRFVAARNIPSREHPYGDGIGKRSLVRARILNKLTRDLLISSGRSANPPRVVDPIIKQQLRDENEIGEGELLTQPDRLGKNMESVQTLDVASDLAGILQTIQHQEAKISSQLPTTSSAYKVSRQSTQEIQQRLRDQEKRLGPLRSHYLKEGVSRHLRRFYQIAKEQGYFNSPEYKFETENLERKEPKFNFDALLLQSYRLTKSLLLNQSLTQAQALLAVKPTASHKLDGDVGMDIIFEGNSSMEAIRTDEEVERERQAIQQIQQQQQQESQQMARADSIQGASEALKNVTDVLQGG